MGKKLHLCAFLSHQLSPAERNYNEGDQDLLVVKLALKECNESMKLLFQLRGIIY